jgi:hypothetical protein
MFLCIELRRNTDEKITNRTHTAITVININNTKLKCVFYYYFGSIEN